MTTGYEDDKGCGGEEGRHKNDASNGVREFVRQTKRNRRPFGYGGKAAGVGCPITWTVGLMRGRTFGFLSGPYLIKE
jgi:hypothetical protein